MSAQQQMTADVDVVVATRADEVMPLIRKQMAVKGKAHIVMAKHLGISEVHMSRIMNGKSGLSLPMLFAILEYLDISMLLAGGEPWTAQPMQGAAGEDGALRAS